MTVAPVLSSGTASKADMDAAAQLAANEVGRLALVRARGEKWVSGLTSLTGLLTTVFVIKGPDSVTDLPDWAKFAEAGLIAVALAVLAGATYLAYSSAYGAPGDLVQVDPSSLTGLAERVMASKSTAAATAERQIGTAVKGAFVALALLAIATGLTWFAPAPSPAPSPAAGATCISVNGKVIAKVPGKSVAVTTLDASGSIAAC